MVSPFGSPLTKIKKPPLALGQWRFFEVLYLSLKSVYMRLTSTKGFAPRAVCALTTHTTTH
jgi:hypothetical protein